MSEQPRPFPRTPNGQGGGSSQQQLPTPPDSAQPGGGRFTGGPGSRVQIEDAQGGQDQPFQPGGRDRRYTTYPELVDPSKPQPAPFQSNGRRRRRTQAELLMHHALAWLGYGEVVPNVSVVTGDPLMDGSIPTHGTWPEGAGDRYNDDEVDKLAENVSRALTIGVNRNAAEKQQGLKRGGN